MNPYIPIIVMVALAAIFVVVMIFVSTKVGPSRFNLTKYDSFECGVQPTPQPAGGARFSVKYYIIAMLFIVFDIEIVFLYPWAVAFDKLSVFALVAMIFFVVAVAFSFFYVWRRGGLEWE